MEALLDEPMDPRQGRALELTDRLADWKLHGSCGSVGEAYDNAAMESFWAPLNREVEHIWGPVEGFVRSELRTVLFTTSRTSTTARRQVDLDDRIAAETYAVRRAA